MIPLQFEYPWILCLLWLAPLLGVLLYLWATRRPQAAGFLSPAMAARLAPGSSPVRRAWQIILVSLSVLLALVALARPQWGSREETIYQRGRDVMLVLDVSRSMLATDVHPSRLGRAKVDLMDLVRQLNGDRVGLLAFRGRPVLLCPLTTDYGYLRQALEGVDIDSAPAGETDIGDAIVKAMESFEDEGSHRAIVLISDGDDLSGRVEAAIEKAREKGVVIFTVGLGSTEGARVPAAGSKQAYMSYHGSEVTSKLNHQVMQSIAEKTGGAYVPVGLANVKLGDLYRDHLSRVSARDLEESVQRRAVERFQLFLLPAVLCLLLAAFLSRGQTWLGRQRPAKQAAPPTPPPVPATPPPLAAVAGLLLAGALASAHAAAAPTNAPAAEPAPPAPIVASTNIPPGRAGALKAQTLYAAGRYEDAAAAYLGAARGVVGKPRFDYLYNAGCALLKAGRDQEAADTFRGLLAMQDGSLADASYNLGCSLNEAASKPTGPQEQPSPETAEARVDALAQAVAAFQRTARITPDDADTHRNLAVVGAKALQAQDDARIVKAMAANGQTPPDALADRMLQQQRRLVADIPAAFTNTTPELITALEALARQQDDTADLMIPLKGKLLEALARQPPPSASNAPSPQQMAAQVNGFAESIRDSMAGAADALRDLDPGALDRASRAENATYHLWKGLAAYGALLQEDIRRQSNAVVLTSAQPESADAEARAAIAADQAEALELTGLFTDRFQQAVPKEGLQVPVQPATNTPAGASTNAMKQVLSPEDRARIVELAGQAVHTQQAALGSLTHALAASLPHQRRSHAILKEIERLLPKQEPPPQQQQQQQQQDPKQDRKDQKQDPSSPQQQQPQPQPQQQPDKPKEDKKPESMANDDVQRMLDKAVQREKEHEAEKRQRDAYAPLSPADRDW